MSKQWKIIVGIGVVLIIVTILCVGTAGFAISRSRNFRAVARQPEGVTQLEVRLIDDNEDGIPDRGIVDLPAGSSLESGVNSPRSFRPGVEPGRGRGFDSPRSFGRGFEPGRFPGSRFGPLGIILGGLFRLAGLAVVVGLIVLGVVLYQRRGSQPSTPDAPAAEPPDTTPEAVEPPAAEPESTEGEADLDEDGREVTEPEDDQADK